MMEVTVDKLSMENAQLLRENEALTAMIAQLQAKHGIEDRANKRVKHEDGIDNSIDSSESAVFATSPQQEKLFLAVLITFLYSTFATIQMLSLPAHHQAVQAVSATAPSKMTSSNYQALTTRIIRLLRRSQNGGVNLAKPLETSTSVTCRSSFPTRLCGRSLGIPFRIPAPCCG